MFQQLRTGSSGLRRKSDANPNTGVVEEAIELLTSSIYGYQIKDCSQHTVAKHLLDEKTEAATNSKLFKKLDDGINSLYEVELAKAEIEHKKPTFVGFSFFKKQNCAFWSFTTTPSPNSVIKTSSKCWKWTEICCILILPRKNWKIVSDLKWDQNCRSFDQMTVSIVSLLMVQQISSREHVV